jgi:hypothetical protein
MTTTPLVQPQLIPHQDLIKQLFTDSHLHAYAVLDGASNPALLDHLYDVERPEFACLYRGELEPDIAECAPYLVRLQQGSAFTQWLVGNCLGNHWGIFALSQEELPKLLHHFRKLNIIYDGDSNQPVLFRYYDPRVLRNFLPTCSREVVVDFFGPVKAYFAEAEDADAHIRFDRT